MSEETGASGAAHAASASKPIPTVAELFWGFFIIGVSGFGGVLPFARREIVEQRRWLTPEEFLDLWSLCQFLPGPNIVNISLVIGRRFRGWKGCAAAGLGLIGAPFAIIIGVGVLHTAYGGVPEVQGVLRGIAAVAAGLLVAMSFKMATGVPRNWRIVFAALVFVSVALMRLPLALVLLALVPASIATAWYRK